MKATLIVEMDCYIADLRDFERQIGAYFDSLDIDTSHIEAAPGDMEEAFGVKKP